MTAAPADTIHRAVMYLAGRCDGAAARDGAGYNRYDVGIGHRMADAIEAGRAINLVVARKVVAKYRAQLERGGIVLPDAAEVEAIAAAVAAAPRPAPESPVKITAAGTEIRIEFPYDPKLVEAARTLPNRRFNGTSKCWMAPVADLDAVLAAFPGARVEASLPAARDAALAAAAAIERARLAQLATDLAAYEAIKASVPLYAHQDTAIRWMIEQRKCILASDMGLGKTRMALVAARSLRYRIFVVAPAGLRINWLREAEMSGAQIEIFSWAKIPEAIDGEFTLIADEAHYAQAGQKSQRGRRFLALAKKSAACFALSGTPIKNGRPINLFPLLLAIDHPLSKNKKVYDVRYCAAHATKWCAWDVTGAAHLEELHERTADGILRQITTDCLDLPELTRVTRKAELSAAAQETYDAVLSQMQASYRARKAAGEIKPGADALVELGQLMHAGSRAKVESAIELAEEVLEQGGQVVLFAKFLDTAHELATALNAGRITGAEDAEQRQDAIDRFQRGEIKAMVCTLGAGNVGITLTAAHTVILVDRPWTPGDAQQAEKRCHRIGTTSNVLSIWLQANGADEALDALLQSKHEKIEVVLTGKRNALPFAISSLSDVAEAVLGR